MSRYCSGCDSTLPIENFGIDKHGTNQHTAKCKTCRNQDAKEYRGDNKDKISIYNKKYREDNKEKVQSYYKKTDEQKEENKKVRIVKHFNEFKTTIERNGGICIGTVKDYKGAHIPIKVKCKDGHEWNISPNNAKGGRWCPTCHTYISELVALEACTYLFDKQFIKTRPPWLTNDQNNRLEIDIYNDDLYIEFTY